MKFSSKKKITKEKLINFYKSEKDKIESAINIKLDLKEKRELKDLRLSIRSAMLKAKSEKEYDLAIDVEELANLSGMDKGVVTEELIIQSGMADYVFDKYKSKKAKKINNLTLLNADSNAFKRAELVLESISYSRDLANTPGSEMTPSTLAAEAKKLAKTNKKFKLKVYSKKELQKMGAGAILAVGSASKHEPKLIVLEYKGSQKSKDFSSVFVGKGITFDTGGLDIKPAGKFVDMYQDMSGAASVLALAKLVSGLNLDKNIVFIIPSAENAIGSESYRPGDIIKGLSGKTIEVGHTDAEGRLILSDAISYAKKYRPALLVTVATLTGAALVALGQEANAIMSSDEEFAWELKSWGYDSGDYVWPLPLWDEYLQIMKGTFADLNNIQNKGSASYGGTTTAGAFLYEFAKEVCDTFLHIDMAPRMTAGPNDKLPKEGGALGGPVRFMLEILSRKV